jgi:iron-sulfur cluster repair protein YtfE (RIC family)
MLKEDHDNVKQLLEKSVQEETKDYFKELKDELDVHMEWEENYFYPEFKNMDEKNILKGYYEHEITKKVLNDLNGDKEELNEWIPKISVLKTLVNEHVKSEEETVFDLAEKNLSSDKENQIKEELIEKKKKKGIFKS